MRFTRVSRAVTDLLLSSRTWAKSCDPSNIRFNRQSTELLAELLSWIAISRRISVEVIFLPAHRRNNAWRRTTAIFTRVSFIMSEDTMILFAAEIRFES